MNAMMQEDLHFNSLLSWKSIFAGTLLSILFYVVLLSLGVGIAGVSLDNTPDLTNMKAETMGLVGGVWIILASALALFAGSYIATRTTAFSSRSIGMWQASVISALFFMTLLLQMSSLLGSAGRLFGSVAGAGAGRIAQTMSEMASNPKVQDILGSAMSELRLNEPTDQVAQGVLIRLVQNDVTAARNYLARQSNLTPGEVQTRIDMAKTQLDDWMVQARQTMSGTLAAAGFAMFVVMVVGLMSAVVGGYLGARENVRHPVTSDEVMYIRSAPANV